MPAIIGADATAVTLVVGNCTSPGDTTGVRLLQFRAGTDDALATLDLPAGVTQGAFGADGTTPLSAATAYRFKARARQDAQFGNVSAASAWAVPPFTSMSTYLATQFLAYGGSAPSPTDVTSWTTRMTTQASGTRDLPVELAAGSYVTNMVDVIRLYRAYFSRIPDKSGLDYWTLRVRNGTKTLGDVSANFAQSTEFKTKYGSLSNTAFVDRVYLNVLERPADASGRTYWVGRLNAGTITKPGVMSEFAFSSEGKRRAQPMTDRATVYRQSLDRMPATVEPYTGYDLADGFRNEFVAVVGSEEYAVRIGAANPGAPQLDYTQLFTRFDKPYGAASGDGGFSARLPDGRIVWNLQDGMLARQSGTWGTGDPSGQAIRGRALVGDDTFRDNYRNALVLTRPGTNEFATPGATTMRSSGRYAFFAPTDFAPALPTGHVYWGAAMTVAPVQGSPKLLVFLVDSADRTTTASLGRRIAIVDPDTLAIDSATAFLDPTHRPIDGAGTGDLEWGSAIVQDGAYTYVYALWNRDASFENKMAVARVPSGSLTDEGTWKYWSVGDQWADDPTSLKSVADLGSNSVIKTDAGYTMFFLDHLSGDLTVKRTVRAFTADSPTGPWLTAGDAPSASCALPDDADLGLSSLPVPSGNHVSKQAIAHPEIEGGPAGTTLLSVANALSGPQPAASNQGHGYRLRLFRFDLTQAGGTCTPA